MKNHHTEIDDDFETILVCTERYALGRRSYMPSLVIGYITPLLPQLSKKTLAVLEKDIAGADDYGDETIDRPCWMKFLADIRAVLAESDEKDERTRGAL